MTPKANIIFAALNTEERATLPFVDTQIVANLIEKFWGHIVGADDVNEIAAQVQTLAAKVGA